MQDVALGPWAKSFPASSWGMTQREFLALAKTATTNAEGSAALPRFSGTMFLTVRSGTQWWGGVVSDSSIQDGVRLVTLVNDVSVAVVVLPTATLCMAAFRKFLFIRNLPALFDARQYSLGHFEKLFANTATIDSIINTMEVGMITAVVGGLLSFAIGYTIARSRAPARTIIDLVVTIPVAIPGLVIGVAYLWAWIGIPFGLYGTLWILALAFVARFLPDTVKALSTSLMQIHRELEEAAWISGRGVLSTIATIVLPLARPGVVAAMTLLFVLAIRELGSSLFLYSSGTIVMAVQLLNFYEGGNTGLTAAFSLVQMVLLGVLITCTNWLSRGGNAGSVGRSG